MSKRDPEVDVKNLLNTKDDNYCNQLGELAFEFEEVARNERRTLLVVLITAVMMVVEVAAGYVTGSMALLADGYHMASHAGALGITYIVYRLARSKTIKAQLTFGSGKLLPLGGYSSAIILGMIALWMAAESIARIFNPVSIEFNEAIFVGVLGLAVNVASAWILGGSGQNHPGNHNHGHHHHGHHDHGHHDHGHHNHGHSHAHPHTKAHLHIEDNNHKSAVLHVLADALTSVTAIVALLIGKYYQASWIDPLMGVLGSLVILRWAFGLCKDAAWELLDGHAKGVSIKEIREKFENS